MRVLSIPQPWAHLVVHRLRTVEVRAYGNDYRGRIAIHASSAMPSKEIDAEWSRDEQNARAIPRFDFDEALYAALGRVGATYGWNEPRVRPVPVVIPEDQFAWTFAYALPINPVTGVGGQQHLWTLPREISCVVGEREAATRMGAWRAPQVNEAKRRRAKADWERAWSRVYDDLGWQLLLEAAWEFQVEDLQFDDPDTEDGFRKTMKHWVAKNGVVVPGRGLHVRLEPHMRRFFDGRETVRVLEFEATMREVIQEQTEREKDDARAYARHARVVEHLRELKGKAARRPMSNAEIVRRVKDEFRREIEAAVEAELRERQRD